MVTDGLGGRHGTGQLPGLDDGRATQLDSLGAWPGRGRGQGEEQTGGVTNTEGGSTEDSSTRLHGAAPEEACSTGATTTTTTTNTTTTAATTSAFVSVVPGDSTPSQWLKIV